MSSFGEKLKTYRSAMGYSQNQLAEIVNTSKQVISRYESQQRVPKLTVAQKYADALHLPLIFLIDNSISFCQWERESLIEDYWNAKSDDRILLVEKRGIDPRIASDYAKLIKEREDYSLPANAIPYSQPKHTAPILGRIPAGYPLFSASEIEGYAPIDYPDPANYFWLRVSGDSMMNAGIQTGDLVLIRQQSCADDGQIVAARVNGDEATLKRFRRVGDTVMLVPENPSYTPIPVPVSAFETGDAAIIGVVVELKRKF